MTLDPRFIEASSAALGREAADAFCRAVDTDPSVSIRLNPIKQPSALTFATECPVPWNGHGRYLASRPAFALDPLFHAGAYYVQDAASMAVGPIVGMLAQQASSPLRILDLCAAPGGKSTDILAHAPSSAIVVCNEVISSRASILAENVAKWGSANAIVANDDPSSFSRLPAYFDIIVADVPCSGEGMFRKDASAIEQWSPEAVEMCAARQRRIIADVWPALKSGGHLIYSTCTLNSTENEENIRWICSSLGAEALPTAQWFSAAAGHAGQPIATGHGLQFVPGITRGEGFFCAVLQKTREDGGARQARKAKGKGAKVSKARCSFIDDCYDITAAEDGTLKAFVKGQTEEIEMLRGSIKVIRSGIVAGYIKGRDIVPDHAAALSRVLKPDHFSSVELSLDDALRFLRKEPLTLSGAPRGHILLKYNNIAIGFIKNLGNRCNNLYPQAWRLRI